MNKNNMQSQNILTKLAAYIILALTFLLPIFFLPNLPVSFQYSKTIIVSVCVISVLILWVISKIQEGKVSVYISYITLGAILVVLTTLASAVFSKSQVLGLLGTGEETYTFSFLAILVVLTFLITSFFHSKVALLYMHLAILASAILLALFHLLRIFSGYRIFSSLSSPVFNTIGSWTDLGIFFGLVALLSCLALYLIQLPRNAKIILYILMAVSIFFIFLTNYFLLWYVFGALSLLMMVYLMSVDNDEKKSFPVAPVIFVVVSFLAIIAGGTIGRLSQSLFNVSVIEARPGWLFTMQLFRDLMPRTLLVGTGPETFVYQWLTHLPSGFYNTIFWNVDFKYGIGIIPTAAITTGLIGLIAWLVFLGSVIYKGFTSLHYGVSNSISRYYITSSFLACLYLFVVHIIYTPSVVLTVFLFIFTGLFISALLGENLIRQKVFSFAKSSKAKGLFMLASVAVLMVTISWGYLILKNFASHVYLQKATAALASGNIDEWENDLVQSVAYNKSDTAYRLLANADIMRLSQIVNEQGVSDSIKRTKFISTVSSAITNVNNAIAYNPYNYQNFVTAGYLYESLVPLKTVDGAYENAVQAYTKALELNKNNPSITLLLGRLEAVNGNYNKAKEYVMKSLAEKQGYVDAIFLLSQIQVAEGDVTGAINSVEQATLVTPNDPSVYFQLGLLKYNKKDYSGSAMAFEKAITLAPDYANAKYFLGLSSFYLGKVDQAISLFEDLKRSNSDNQEVQLILRNLNAGRAPFQDAEPPIDNKPEKRSELPIEEN